MFMLRAIMLMRDWLALEAGASNEDDGVTFVDDGWWVKENPAGRRPAGFVVVLSCWSSVCRASVTAVRADALSTMLLLVAKAAIRAWIARLFTARGRRRLTWWMRSAAASLNSGSLRPRV
jgi:hypothetical protein